MSAATRPEKITFGECWCRDGLQSISTQVSTADKIEMLNGMTGFWYAWSRFYPNTQLFGALEEFPE